jgi:hypothetical protein
MKPSPFRLGFFISQKTTIKIVVWIVVNYPENTLKTLFCSNIEINRRHTKGNTERRLHIFYKIVLFFFLKLIVYYCRQTSILYLAKVLLLSFLRVFYIPLVSIPFFI